MRIDNGINWKYRFIVTVPMNFLSIIDGAVGTVTLGFIGTNFALDYGWRAIGWVGHNR